MPREELSSTEMKHSKILLTSILGNTLEYYEFSIFAVFAVQIGECFFPEQSSSAQLLLTLTLFASGFISRPFGSLLFGHIGDKLGRQYSLMITIAGMSTVTLVIGLMPGFAKIGIAAPILLCFLRLLQGVFIGGEGAGSAVYILEHELKFKRSVIGGLLVSSNIAGTICASIIGLLINAYVGLNEDSWRLAFFFGAAAGLIVSIMRLQLPESQTFKNLSPENKRDIPVVTLFVKYWRQMLLVISLGGFSASLSYMLKGYLNIHLQQFMHLSSEQSFSYLLFASTLFAVIPPFIGYFFCNGNNKLFIRIVSAMVLIFYLPSYYLITVNDPTYIIAGIIALVLLAALIMTPTYTYFSTIFPAEVRYSGVAISFNIGITLIGGFTPLISTYLSSNYDILSPAIYISCLAFLYLISDFIIHYHINKKLAQNKESLI